jgi:hypothetical protein
MGAKRWNVLVVSIAAAACGPSSSETSDEDASELRRCADDGNPCTSDVVIRRTCTHSPVTDGTSCPNGTCTAGVCVQSDPPPPDASSSTSGSAILPVNRRAAWDHAGVVQSVNDGVNNGPRGIPSFPTCTAYTVTTAASIQTALDNCPEHTVVSVPAGTFVLPDGLRMRRPVVLRGAGPDKTVLQTSDVVQVSPYGTGEPTLTVVDWTGGYTQGETVLTLASTAGLHVGDEIGLDQENDPNVVFCGKNGCAPLSRDGTRAEGGSNREVLQMVQITAIAGNQITIDTPLYMTHSATLHPQAFWWPEKMHYAGVESLKVDLRTTYNISNVSFTFCTNCWVRNVATVNSHRSAINFSFYVYHGEIRDSFVDGHLVAQDGEWGTNYGIELGWGSAVLVENNIVRGGNILQTYPGSGIVLGHNYVISNVLNTGWMGAGIQPHAVHTYMNLTEGNQTTQFNEDNIYGSGSLNVLYRNRLTSTQANAGGNTPALKLGSHHRYDSVIGNVLGTNGFNTTYEQVGSTPCSGQDHTIFVLGYWDECYETYSTAIANYDPMTVTTLLRWGNYDTVTGSTRFSASELPSGVTMTTTLPASMYLPQKPAWWGQAPWPSIGPDVTGGDAGVGGHAYDVPAKRCYDSTVAKGLPFNGGACYGAP